MASPDCNFLMLQKLDCTPEILVLGVFLPKKVIYAPLVRMRSPVQIWSAAPVKPVVPQGTAGFCFFLGETKRMQKPIQKPIPTKF